MLPRGALRAFVSFNDSFGSGGTMSQRATLP
jgi:hypothetical protein